jgi:DNA transposition AAA+ family ATPase
MTKLKRVPDISKAGVDFLKTELHTGLTLASIALENENPDKVERNRKNARQAYDTVIRDKERVLLTDEESEYVSHTLQELRKKLEKLGEQFRD